MNYVFITKSNFFAACFSCKHIRNIKCVDFTSCHAVNPTQVL